LNKISNLMICSTRLVFEIKLNKSNLNIQYSTRLGYILNGLGYILNIGIYGWAAISWRQDSSELVVLVEMNCKGKRHIYVSPSNVLVYLCIQPALLGMILLGPCWALYSTSNSLFCNPLSLTCFGQSLFLEPNHHLGLDY
jgi:hypothetical protein